MDSPSWNTKTQETDIKYAKGIRTVISTTLGIVGIGLLISQLYPLAASYIEGKVYERRAETLAAPIPDSEKELIQGEFAYYNPGVSYFQNLSGAIEVGNLSYDPVTNEFKEVVIDEEYLKAMEFSISDIDIENVNLSSNVESYDEDVYNLELKKGLAHFKGTPLPGDGGNSFIYGHSAVPAFFSRHEDLPETIFSKLDNVDIGNEVVVKRDGKELKYIVRNKKIVESTDFSVLQPQGDKETITMMTCWPLGVPSKRLIVTAERYE
jgi:LPXTG-site transpeptidase (sortase) family protein